PMLAGEPHDRLDLLHRLGLDDRARLVVVPVEVPERVAELPHLFGTREHVVGSDHVAKRLQRTLGDLGWQGDAHAGTSAFAPKSSRVASRAPSARAASLAHWTSGWTRWM